MEDEDRPRTKGDAASTLASEDLAPYSQDELAERVVLLETEIDNFFGGVLRHVLLLLAQNWDT